MSRRKKGDTSVINGVIEIERERTKETDGGIHPRCYFLPLYFFPWHRGSHSFGHIFAITPYCV